VSKKLKERNFSNKTYALFKKDMKELFNSKNNYACNYRKFFEPHRFVQKATKPKKVRKLNQPIERGTTAIVSYLSKLKVSKVDIFAGPLLDLEKIESRLRGMVQGLRDNKNLSVKGSIRLTLISTKEGYKNLNQQLLEKLLDYLISDKKVSNYISGFDF
jgi:hypothetical protein